MGARFVLGRAGSGKTHLCVAELLRELEKDERRPLALLVPEQMTFQIERALALVSPRRGYWRAEILSFKRLTRRMADRFGGPETLSRAGRGLGLRRIVSQHPELLRPFGRGVASRGFHQQLQRAIEEMLREGVTPTALRDSAAGLDDAASRSRVEALADILSEYVAWLGPHRVDPAQALSLFRAKLGALDVYRDASIWVDGFAGFTAEELETLVALARQARDLTLTLLIDNSGRTATADEPDLFRRARATYSLLAARFAETGVAIESPLLLLPAHPPRFRSPSLSLLERGLATWPEEPPTSDADGDSAVRIVRFATHREELESVARFIRRRVIESDGKLRFRDFALVTRDLGPFVDEIARAFERFELPYFLDRRRSLEQHALTRLVDAIFDAASSDFAAPAMIRLLQTGLTPLSRGQAESIENHILRHELYGIDVWRRRHWSFSAGVMSADAAADCDRRRLRLASALTPLFDLSLTRDQAAPATQWASVLEEALEHMGVRQRLTAWIREEQTRRDWEAAELHRLAWDALCDLIEEVAAALGDTPLTAAEARDVFVEALRDVTMGLAPPTLDQVLIGSIERSRHPDVKYVWLFGFNDGVFPARPGADAVLTSNERQALQVAGLSMLRSRADDLLDERMLAYVAMTRPSQGLIVSYSATSLTGEPSFPSPFLDRVRVVFQGALESAATFNTGPSHIHELPQEYFGAQRLSPEKVERRRIERLVEVVSTRTSRGLELSRLLRGRDYRNQPAPIGPWRLEDANGRSVWRVSPSELERYLKCPFQHFAKHGLRIDPVRGPKPLHSELGQLAHDLIASVTRRAMTSKQRVQSISDEQWRSWIVEESAALSQRQAQNATIPRPRVEFLFQCLTRLTTDMLLAHAARWRAGQLQPVAVEQAFGDPRSPETWPALWFSFEGGVETEIHGRIDRVDVCEVDGTPLSLVYDYKSSVTFRPKSRYLTLESLQLYLYLLAATQTDMRRAGGALFAPLFTVTKQLQNKKVREAQPDDARMALFMPRGVIDARLGTRLDTGVEGRDGASPVAKLTWTKQKRFRTDDDVKPSEVIRRLLSAAEEAVASATKGVVEGRVDVAPLVDRNRLACSACDFRPLCRFEMERNRPQLAELRLPLIGGAADRDEDTNGAD